MVIWVKIFQTELMSEIYSKSPVRAIGKILLEKMAFVCKQTAVLVVCITLDNNNDVLADFYPLLSLHTLPHASVGLTDCISVVFLVLNILTRLTTMLLLMSL